MLELTIKEAVDLIKAVGTEVTVMLQGEPGIGKTTIGNIISEQLNRTFAYMDMANMSLGDLLLPVANREQHCAEFYPNEILKLHLGLPTVIMMDEWTKASKEVKNMTLPMSLERRLGSVKFHKDTIVLATGNMAGEGLNDSIQAHQMDRFIMVKIRKPTAEEWINNYGLQNDIHPVVLAFVEQFPQVLQSYHDDPNGDNKYIFNPRKQQPNFVTPRSLRYASDILKKKEFFSENALQAALAGAIGQAAAADLTSFVHMDEQLPPLKAIVADPTGCSLPDKPTTRLLLTFNLIQRSDKENIKPILQYVERLDNEMQALFMNKMLSTPSKSTWACQVPEMVKRAIKLHYLF